MSAGPFLPQQDQDQSLAMEAAVTALGDSIDAGEVEPGFFQRIAGELFGTRSPGGYFTRDAGLEAYEEERKAALTAQGRGGEFQRAKRPGIVEQLLRSGIGLRPGAPGSLPAMGGAAAAAGLTDAQRSALLTTNPQAMAELLSAPDFDERLARLTGGPDPNERAQIATRMDRAIHGGTGGPGSPEFQALLADARMVGKGGARAGDQLVQDLAMEEIGREDAQLKRDLEVQQAGRETTERYAAAQRITGGLASTQAGEREAQVTMRLAELARLEAGGVLQAAQRKEQVELQAESDVFARTKALEAALRSALGGGIGAAAAAEAPRSLQPEILSPKAKANVAAATEKYGELGVRWQIIGELPDGRLRISLDGKSEGTFPRAR